MYLINALAFDAQWKETYKEHQVRKGTFTTQSGREQTVQMMSSLLTEMGMPNAFDERLADFSRLGTAGGNIYIGRVLHKTHITLTEQGTRAAASTVVEMKEECAIEYTDTKTVHLTRSYLYFLIDTTTNTPFFIGAVQSIHN